MLLIRNEQLEVFKQAAAAQSAEELTGMLCERYPIHCQVAGKPALKSLVDAGIGRAVALGLEKRGEVQTYVELSLLLGYDFENDPQIPWAGNTLRRQDAAPVVEKLEQVYTKAIDFLNQVAGTGGANMDQTLRVIENASVETLIPSPSPDFRDQLLQTLRGVFPQKADTLGLSKLNALVDQGKNRAEALGMMTPFGHGLCVWLAFLLGSGFADDPLFPWVGQVLASASPPESREHHLAHEAKAYLGRWLQALNQGGA
jgi:hypothetical protein